LDTIIFSGAENSKKRLIKDEFRKTQAARRPPGEIDY